jgi:protein phosphatase
MFGASDLGRVRKSNQDAFYCSGSQGIALVADGIGGRKGGEVASKLAVEGMKKAIVECESLRHEEVNPFLVSAIDRINNEIISTGNTNGTPGMGTTLECLMFVGDKVHVAHVGDSRTYLFYKNHLWQLTIDHNLKTFVDRGWMVRSEISPRMKEEALVKSLGLTARCEIDIYNKTIQDGEIYLTCSDGLSSMIDNRKMSTIIREQQANPERLPRLLIDEANAEGGRDNITVVVTRVVGRT